MQKQLPRVRIIEVLHTDKVVLLAPNHRRIRTCPITNIGRTGGTTTITFALTHKLTGRIVATNDHFVTVER